MKKKLLSILLSIFMITTSFTTRIFADEVSELSFSITPITIGDLSDLPENNISGSSLEDDICTALSLNFYLFNESNNIIAYACDELGTWKWKNEDGSDYEGTPDFNSVSYVIEEISFIPNDGSFAEEMTIKINGGNPLPKRDDMLTGEECYSIVNDILYVNVKVYSSLKTIADILPSNFPASDEDNSWCNSENDNVYIYKTDSNLVFNDSTEDCYSVPLSSSLTKEENPKVSYVYSVDGTKIQFNMTGDDNDELENIVVNNCTIFACVGTYYPPAVKVTPYIKTNPAPNDIDLGEKLSDSTLSGGYVQVSSTDSTQIAGQFNWTNPNTIPTLADSNVTQYSVTFTPIDTINYTTVSCEVLITVNHATHNPILVNGQAPTETASGWKDYYECVCGNYYEDAAGNTLIPDLAVWKAEGGNGYLAPITPAKTVAEVLATVEGGFPTVQDDGWVNENGKKIYVNGNILTVTYNVPLESALQKDGDNYKYINGSRNCTFVMTSGKLTKIIVSGAIFSVDNGEYVPQTNYVITDGKQATININDNKDVIFKSNADISKFVRADVDNATVDPSYYSAVSGSTKVTMKASYLSTLDEGTHTLTIVSTDGKASTTFTITKNNTSPNPRYNIPNTGVEGVSTNNHSLLKLSSLSLLAVGTYLVIKKKKDN